MNKDKNYVIYASIIILLILANMFLTGKILYAYKSLNDYDYTNSVFKPQKESKKVVYLTFDDGPTYVVTDQLLDVLKQYKVKATFFVVGKEIKQKEHILTRIYEEGHGIGLHTYTHNDSKIYSSKESFLDEMNKTQELVKELTGSKYNVIRFPGGLHSRHNSLGCDLVDELHKNNFKIYDWNVDLQDGVNPNLSPEQLLENSKKVIGNNDSIFILAHCNFNNKNTVKALPKIINYYKNLGYDFKTITDSTPEFYIPLKK